MGVALRGSETITWTDRSDRADLRFEPSYHMCISCQDISPFLGFHGFGILYTAVLSVRQELKTHNDDGVCVARVTLLDTSGMKENALKVNKLDIISHYSHASY